MTIKYLSYCQRTKPELIDVFYSGTQHCVRLISNESFPNASRNGASQPSVFLFFKIPIHLHKVTKPQEDICCVFYKLEREAHHAGEPPSLARQCRNNQVWEQAPEILWLASVTSTSIGGEWTVLGLKTL